MKVSEIVKKKKISCVKHNLEIGAVCDNKDCFQLLCIKCAVDKQSCIRKHNHKLIEIDEFFDCALRNDYLKFSRKNDYQHDKLDIKEIVVYYTKIKGKNKNFIRRSFLSFDQ